MSVIINVSMGKYHSATIHLGTHDQEQLRLDVGLRWTWQWGDRGER